MAAVRKTVRFYQTIHVDSAERQSPVQGGYWTDLIAALEIWTPTERESSISGVTYFGLPKRPIRPALPHVQVGRVRDLTEQLDRYNVYSGSLQPLDFADPNDRVAEPTYIVPFGTSNLVAIMSPGRVATRSETLARWITGVTDLVPRGETIEFRPVVDLAIVEKLLGSSGAVMLDVQIDRSAEIPATGGGDIGDAIRSAKAQSDEELNLEMRWSLGRATGSSSVRDALQNAALWIANTGWTNKAKVTILSDDGNGGWSRDIHSLFDDRVAKAVEFTVPDGQRASEETLLYAIAEAIREFQRP